MRRANPFAQRSLPMKYVLVIFVALPFSAGLTSSKFSSSLVLVLLVLSNVLFPLRAPSVINSVRMAKQRPLQLKFLLSFSSLSQIQIQQRLSGLFKVHLVSHRGHLKLLLFQVHMFAAYPIA